MEGGEKWGDIDMFHVSIIGFQFPDCAECIIKSYSGIKEVGWLEELYSSVITDSITLSLYIVIVSLDAH